MIVLKISGKRVRDMVERTLKTFIAAVAVSIPFSRWLTLSGQPLPQIWAFVLPPSIAGLTAVWNYWIHVGEASKAATVQKRAQDLQNLAFEIDRAAQAKVPGLVQQVLDGLAASGRLSEQPAPSPSPVSLQQSPPPSSSLPGISPGPIQA